MLTLLCGPSSAGKSTLYSSGALARFLGGRIPPSIRFAYEFEGDEALLAAEDAATDSVIHYNMMRPLEALKGQTGSGQQNDVYSAWSYDLDLAWKKIVKLPGPKQALVLVASRQALLDRVSYRRDIEPDLVAKDGNYDYLHWHAVYRDANLPLVYSLFASELRANGIEPRYIAARDGIFDEISEPAVLGELIGTRRVRYTSQQIADFIQPSTFEYQKVSLPHGLSTVGHDRAATCNLVLPQNLHGATVLDIGSALGAVCFAAERRGAASVVGLEPRASRFEAGVILKEILGSAVELRRETLDEFMASERQRPTMLREFDYVLLLNVLHHLDDPLIALRQCALLTKRYLIIEFPTLNDPIFAGVPPELSDALNRLPLIGVSTTSADQRFIFTERSLERVLLDHQPLFRTARFLPSPMQGGRMIGIFEK